MKRISIIVSAIIAVILLALIIVPHFIPTSVYHGQIEKAATDALGRQVTLQGDPKLSLFPSISAKIEGAKVANPDGFTGDYMVEAGTLKGKIRLLPLFSRRVEISQITLSDASVRLEQLADGRNNWTFASAGTPEEAPDTSSSGGFSAGVDSARLQNTSISYIDRATDTQYALEDLDIFARMKATDAPLSSNGTGKLNGQAFDYDIAIDSIDLVAAGTPADIDLDLETDFGRIRYDGTLQVGEIPTLNGDFDIRSETIGSLIQFLGSDLPIRGSEMQSILAEGTISGSITNPKISFGKLEIGATGLGVIYDGLLDLTGEPVLDGRLDVKADQPQRIFKPEIEGLDALALLRDFSLKGEIDGPISALTLTDTLIKQNSDLLTVDFSGDLSLAQDGQSNGALKASSANMRALLDLFNVQLADGETMQAFAVDGTVAGSRQTLALTNASVTLDDLTATGTLGADLSGAKPRVEADLTMPALDLTPFLGSGNQDTTTPANLNNDWNDDPLALEGLKAVDAVIDINAGSITLGKVTLNDALLKTRLDKGRLSASFERDDAVPGFKAFDGNWSGNLQLNAAAPTPTLSLRAKADSITTQKMLSALMGYTGLTGLGGIDVDLRSSGNSIKSLVNGLDGSVASQVANGDLAGINLAQMVRSAENLEGLIRSGGLSAGSFRDAISPEAETDFSSLNSGLSFQGGVGTIQQLNLSNPVVSVSGSGQIDLGARTFDIRLVPTIDRRAQGQGSTLGIDQIPIPVRISGPWTKPSFGLDANAVQQELTRRLTGQLEDRIRGELGNVLGRSQPTTPSPQGPTAETNDSDPAQPDAPAKSIEDELKDQAIEGAIGAIFGNRKKDDKPAEDQPPAE